MKTFWVYERRGRYTLQLLVLLTAPRDCLEPTTGLTYIGNVTARTRKDAIDKLGDWMKTQVRSPEQEVLPV